eukprot:COSAG06_NODE_71_length_25945_cov_9.124468_21_plen_170_part_00
MLFVQVGNGMSTIEDQSHFALWCILCSPLIAGNDLRSMSDTTKVCPATNPHPTTKPYCYLTLQLSFLCVCPEPVLANHRSLRVCMKESSHTQTPCVFSASCQHNAQAILSNKGAVSVSQDPLGSQAIVCAKPSADTQVLDCTICALFARYLCIVFVTHTTGDLPRQARD